MPAKKRTNEEFSREDEETEESASSSSPPSPSAASAASSGTETPPNKPPKQPREGGDEDDDDDDDDDEHEDDSEVEGDEEDDSEGEEDEEEDSEEGNEDNDKKKPAGSEEATATTEERRAPAVSTSFEELGLAPWLIGSLSSMAITRPTSIQASCIPEILKGRDCIGGSRTGSGKTVAFATPILHRWAEDPTGIYAVVLTPTRELALQIFEQFKAISAPQSLKPVLITGGTDMKTQAIALSQRPHVVIATPGRLADHINSSGQDTVVGLRRVKVVVLDEADRLLASGKGSMLPDVETCLSALPPSSHRQTLLFTATVTPEVRALKSAPRAANKPPIFMAELSVENRANVPPTLAQHYLQVPATQKEAFLHVFLSTEQNSTKPTIVFCNRTAIADLLERILRYLGHRATSLHSQLPQYERISNLSRFRASAARVLVATDVAARGLDIPTVSLVINYDVPQDPDNYVHRVGRTARAGRKGGAVTFVGQRDVERVLAIEERLGRQMTAWEEEGVNIESRVVKGTTLKEVGVAKRDAMGNIEEGRDVHGRKQNKLKKVR